ncbi:hypothetical protein [Novosphingobium taihuense]|uniref:Uncharacterized protein n=1 Tax=Novosphingobium taihuense TaxID=260085 RepID=A0A7W7ESC7_9SPHN|nr:hypothetical protein [Novosphingobium taihuense]MBB4612153.1 hypothetical protein [Novosphingobium taihuense]TWH88493.1 hypothetical protein IQ25_00615 [Novosphingobium taihuense]
MADRSEAQVMLERYIALRRALNDAQREADALGMLNVSEPVAAAREALAANTTQLGPITFASGEATEAEAHLLDDGT